MKIDKKIIRIIIFTVVSVAVLIYFINLVILINENNNTINSTVKKIEDLNKNIRLEIKNQEKIEKSGKNFLTTAYFDRKEKFFENYIRNLFNKYNIKITIYQSSITEKDNAEIDVTFDTDAFKYFKLLKEMEDGEKIIVLKNLSIVKSRLPELKVNMKLIGFYKD